VKRRLILGRHPLPPNPFGELTSAHDGQTQSNVEHRSLIGRAELLTETISALREMLISHHSSPEMLERSRIQREAISRLGFQTEQAKLNRFPRNDKTRKGNLAEVILAEYLVATERITLPVYRLRYNPNVNQSMKGDDVLLFDFSTTPARIVVGESKYRATSSPSAVQEIVTGLTRSHTGGIPVSLVFVSDRLFESGQSDLGEQVISCGKLFAENKLQIDYVGILVSNPGCATHIDSHTPVSMQNLAMISLAFENPDTVVELCYDRLE
jgi:Cap4 SAVED domain